MCNRRFQRCDISIKFPEEILFQNHLREDEFERFFFCTIYSHCTYFLYSTLRCVKATFSLKKTPHKQSPKKPRKPRSRSEEAQRQIRAARVAETRYTIPSTALSTRELHASRRVRRRRTPPSTCAFKSQSSSGVCLASRF